MSEVKELPDNPLVSVMMPAYNVAAYIGPAIESVLAQSYQNWELIIVNDGSTDGTAEIAGAYQNLDLRVQLIHQPNGGESSARNTALQEMNGLLLAFLDADDLYHPRHLELAVDYLRAHPDVDAVYMDGHYCDQHGRPMETLSSQRRGPFIGDIFEEVVRASDVFGPPICVVLRLEPIIQRHLRFDPEIVIGPDWDFLTHYAQFTRFGYLDETTCLYRVHQTNVTVRTDLERRALYLARCREKAVQLPRFNECSLETRSAVFYDLLVELLNGYPERQTTIIRSPQFESLPASEQARLLRLIFREGTLRGVERRYLQEWLRQARALNPDDERAHWLDRLYRVSPLLCRYGLRVKDIIYPKQRHASPFRNLIP